MRDTKTGDTEPIPINSPLQLLYGLTEEEIKITEGDSVKRANYMVE